MSEIVLSDYEKETVILTSEGYDMVEVFTYCDELIALMAVAAIDFPELFSPRSETGDGGYTYVFPKDLIEISIRSPAAEQNPEKGKMNGCKAT